MSIYVCSLCGTNYDTYGDKTSKNTKFKKKIKCSNDCLRFLLKAPYHIRDVICVSYKNSEHPTYFLVTGVRVRRDVIGGQRTLELKLREISAKRAVVEVEAKTLFGINRVIELRANLDPEIGKGAEGFWTDIEGLKRTLRVVVVKSPKQIPDVK